MQQVADWLEKPGLGQYAQRQLLREIAKLGQTAAAAESAPSVTVPPIAAPAVAPQPEATAERRHVTVMFCDLAWDVSLRLRPVFAPAKAARCGFSKDGLGPGDRSGAWAALAEAGSGIAKLLKGPPQSARGCVYCAGDLSGSLADAGG
jgi:hypothetical protein